MNKIPAAILIILMTASCMRSSGPGTSSSKDLSGGRITVDGKRFTDSFGRQVIFNGINYVNKDPRSNYIFTDTADIFGQFRQWGINCIRLGIIWDGVEPEPGVYDEAYLDKVEEQVRKAEANGLYVFLDMHQDLFSVMYSDGAPEWATITDGLPHATGAIWSDSYFLSPAVQKAFDHFWANTPASDGTGIQDHYAAAWKHIAERFSRYNNVLGYDIMNEPFNGSPGAMILPVILKAYAELYATETGTVLSESDIMNTWADEASRMKALEWMSSLERYSAILGAATDLSNSFESNELLSMYQRVADRIREADTSAILFLEHSYFSNAGVESGVKPVTDKNGNPDRRVVYAAHGYDLLVDTKFYDQSSDERVRFIFSQISKVSDKINRPVLVGEWGAFGGNSEAIAVMAMEHRNLFDSLGFSQTYWAWHPGVEENLYFRRAFLRPEPQFINGTVKYVRYDYGTGKFSCTWEESGLNDAGSVFFVPDLRYLVREDIEINPDNRNLVIQSLDGGNAGFVIVPPSGKKENRRVEFIFRSDSASISIN